MVKKIFLFGSLLFLFLLSSNAQAQPLPADSVVEALKKGLPPARIAVLVTQRGVDFELTKDIEAKLKGAGADDQLIKAVRDASGRIAETRKLQRELKDAKKRASEELAKAKQQVEAQIKKEIETARAQAKKQVEEELKKVREEARRDALKNVKQEIDKEVQKAREDARRDALKNVQKEIDKEIQKAREEARKDALKNVKQEIDKKDKKAREEASR